MKCPVCNNEMKEGGLIIDGIAPCWVPMEQFQKKRLKRFMFKGALSIGEPDLLLKQTKVPNAYFCGYCYKIVGVFDITDPIINEPVFPGV